MSIGILSIIIFLPMLTALLLMVVPLHSRATRNVAFGVSLCIFALALYVYTHFDLTGALQFKESYVWIKSYGITYSVGIDGFSLIILMLIATLIPSAYLLLWNNSRSKSYWINMLFIQAGVSGTLFSLDLFLFYFFWEAMLLPVFMIIGLFGSGNRVFSTLKITIYTIMGSLFMFVSILYLGVAHYYEFGVWSFALSDLVNISTLAREQKILLFFGFMLAFAIKIPLFPFHSWLLQTYSNSPTGGVFLLSSIMAKLGVYALVRFMMPLFPDLFVEFSIYFVALGIFGLVYFGIAAISQLNIKKMFAYSSASHLGFITAGVFALNIQGMMGSAFLIVAHAIATGGLFLLVGVMERHLGIRSLNGLGGIATKAPWFTLFFAIMLFCTVGIPGTNGFVAELLIVLGIFHYNPYLGMLSALTVLVAASYMFWVFQKAVLVKSDNDVSNMKDLRLHEILGLAPLAVLILAMGVYPDLFLYKIEPTLQHYLIDILHVGVK
ncbi:NADH-quinone oxidoreductase subunit M [Sulfurospirillum diekertiae]|uniref:NADH-quinone oxidoreductase subunit M n=1 Tax=Sulfurospirillum diekertiae TaxID=1854492 RepID=A0A6G9VST5_9BACT|nr:NADH-quinone oxidoreductase subunit M [Sulfurospirillum diekertiae]QIR76430.1 NADH-quinone oxidoreductase subunit M [Sulfurospirillum diekertiae]QIR79059.1 NADH-quinone oxidoreductase subunit M [Sulfurospirillum diekertiae]